MNENLMDIQTLQAFQQQTTVTTTHTASRRPQGASRGMILGRVWSTFVPDAGNLETEPFHSSIEQTLETAPGGKLHIKPASTAPVAENACLHP